MTDLEKFIQLYKDFGITIVPINNDEPIKGSKWQTKITLMEDENPKLVGYFGFHSDIYFDKDGKFIEQGFWE